MKEIFLWLLNSSISAAWLLPAILAARLLLCRNSRKFSCLLWALLAIRLLLPAGVESPFSVLPTTAPIQQESFDRLPALAQMTTPAETKASDIPDLTALQNLQLEIQVESKPDLLDILSAIWLVGFLGMLTYAIVGSLILKKRLAPSLPVRSNIYACDYIEEPFVFGVLQPKIYLPSCLKPEELPHVLAHEEAHLRRKDNLWKPLAFLLLALYWFDPLLWIAYYYFCQDVEVACDEAVIRDLDVSEKAAYSRTLLRYSTPKVLMKMPLAFGEKDVTHRIKSIFRYRKPTAWLAGLGVCVIVILSVCFLTDPVHAVPGEKTSEPVNLLLIGKYGTEEPNAKAIVLATLDPAKKELKLTAFPAWTYLEFSNLRDTKNAVHSGSTSLTLGYRLGQIWNGEQSGMMLLSECLMDNFGIPIHGALEIDQDVLVGIVDALGGIDTEEGKLGGAEVCAYQYTSLPEESLYAPAERQITILKAILDTCQALPMDQLSKLSDTVLPLLTTDMDNAQLEEYANELLPLFSSLTIQTQLCPDRASATESQISSLQHTFLIPDIEKCRKILGTNS